MMKKLILIFYFLSTISLFSQYKLTERSSNIYLHKSNIDKNNIEMSFNNWGETYTPYTQSGGFWQIQGEEYPRGIVFDQAPWIIGKINGEIILSGGQWFSAYSPGPIINGQAAMLVHPEDSLKYRVFKINKGDDNSNPDYVEWPIEFGAPTNELGQPLVLGDQTLWTCYNYLDSNLTYPFNPFNNVNPLEIEIHQTVFSRQGHQTDLDDIFSNVIFIEYEIIYKGNEPIDSTYFGFWTDIDFDPYYENRPAVDIPLNLGYCWTGVDTLFDASIPLSVGYTLLYGPLVPEIGVNAIFKGISLHNYKNIQLNAFRGIGYDYPGDSMYTYVQSVNDAWNYAIGLSQNGTPYIDPTTNQQTTFPLSGDPVNNSGWIFENNSTSGEAGMMIFAGPFTFAPNDTQWTMLALVPGLGNSNLNSISAMRKKVQILRSLPYDSLAFGSTAYAITDIEDEKTLPNKFILSQNYPNPFNPTTEISWQSPVAGFHTLKVFDVLGNEVATLVNEFRNAGSYEVYFDASMLSSGVYFYQLKAGNFLQTKKMILIK
jgi:hypothetical protein